MKEPVSRSESIYPLVAALVKAEEILGPQRTWRSVNPQQASFLATYFQAGRQESSTIAEIESIASWEADEINRFLHVRGFQIQLSPFNQDLREKEFGVASVLDVLARWLEAGRELPLQGKDGRSYPGVRLSSGLRFLRAPRHANPLVCLQTTSGDLVYLTQLDQAPEDLLLTARHLSSASKVRDEFGGVHFPMVDLKQESDLSWLLNMQTISNDGLPAIITQALQETRFALNPEGVRAKSAVALKVARYSAVLAAPRKPDLIIDSPFLAWYERPGLSWPLFSSYVTQANWKNPGQITE